MLTIYLFASFRLWEEEIFSDLRLILEILLLKGFLMKCKSGSAGVPWCYTDILLMILVVRIYLENFPHKNIYLIILFGWQFIIHNLLRSFWITFYKILIFLIIILSLNYFKIQYELLYMNFARICFEEKIKSWMNFNFQKKKSLLINS